MATLSLKSNFADVEKRVRELHGAIRDQVLASAINRTLDNARTQMTRKITEEFNVKSAYVRSKLSIRRASAKGQRFEGALSGASARRSVNVVRYLAPGSKRVKTKGKGARGQLIFRILKKGPVTVIPGAFLGNGGRTVFRRVGKGRLPIEPVQAIDVPQMFTTRRVNAQVVATIQQRLAANLERDARFYLERFNRGVGSRAR